jgi:hypothetical protein
VAKIAYVSLPDLPEPPVVTAPPTIEPRSVNERTSSSIVPPNSDPRLPTVVLTNEADYEILTGIWRAFELQRVAAVFTRLYPFARNIRVEARRRFVRSTINPHGKSIHTYYCTPSVTFKFPRSKISWNELCDKEEELIKQLRPYIDGIRTANDINVTPMGCDDIW